MIFSCLITGVGGQGTVLMSRLIGAAALSRGLDVRGSETIGMAQRGGSVVSHIRLGQNIQSPLIPKGKADLIIAFEPAEAVRVYTFLSPTGRILVLDRGIMPVAGMLGKKKYEPAEMLAFLKAFASHPSEERLAQKGDGDWLTVIDSVELIKKCGSTRVLNTALLGAAAGKKYFPFPAEDLLAAIKERIPPEYLEANIRAFDAGRALG
ncbi:MAG: indolepyruvate oxidoreductase subunit beta [Treponema sp.]|nr:indolepyruvate oxidoreductase subunit beta [Treponema sp.]